ncbi:MAG TPA: ribosome maturation factor RimP [Gemmatimonadales bacterium]|jgi:ribosome maturation factor RimP|nr:ribosome maturation factor RimP [Gemmatimonadales bacterium]
MSLDDLIDPVRQLVAALGFELVDLRRSGSPQSPLLQVRVDRPASGPGHGVTAEDCVRVSRALERFLEERAAVGPRYMLQVSSPGIERPLVWPEHWRRFTGQRVRIKGRHSAHSPATIMSVPDEEHVLLRFADGTEAVIPLAEIREATLVVDWPKPQPKKRI